MSTAKEVFEYLCEAQPETITNRELQSVLSHRSPGAIGGALYRLSNEGVIEPIANSGPGYVFAVLDTKAKLNFNGKQQKKSKKHRGSSTHAKRKKFSNNARIREALESIFAALVVLEEELL